MGDPLASSDTQYKETLKAQGTQHTESLAAEDRRLVQRLQHERKQQDVQHLRGFLDAVAMDYRRASAALTWLAGLRTPPVSPAQMFAPARSEAWDAKLKVSTALDRVALWFGDAHAVYRTYAQISEFVNERLTLLTRTNDEFTPEQDEESIRTGAALLTAFTAFATAARDELAGAVAAAQQE